MIMADFDGIAGFDNVGGGEAVATEPKKSEKQEAFVAAAKEIIHNRETNPDFEARYNKFQNALEVTRILAFSDEGNMLNKTDEALDAAVKKGTVTVLADDDNTVAEVTKDENTGEIRGTVKMNKPGASTKYIAPHLAGKPMMDSKNKPSVLRVLVPCPGNVGYEIKNNGTEPIPFKSIVSIKGEDGKWTTQEVDKVLAPGATDVIPKDYFCRMCQGIEFNNVVANGVCVVLGSPDNLQEAFRKSYFKYSDPNLSVNSPECKTLIHDVTEVNGKKKFTVRKEYEETFGYLNNEPEKAAKKPRQKAAGGVKPSRSEVTAALFRKALNMD